MVINNHSSTSVEMILRPLLLLLLHHVLHHSVEILFSPQILSILNNLHHRLIVQVRLIYFLTEITKVISVQTNQYDKQQALNKSK
jgi:hypothetical protein